MKTFIVTRQDRRTGDLDKVQIVASTAFNAQQVAKKHWNDTHTFKAVMPYSFV